VIKVIAIGNLTRDPEMRYTPNGKAVAEFSIASNEGSGERRTTEYLDCQVWDKLAETVAEHCRKGRKVYIEGRWSTESWNDKQTGAKRSKVRIKVNNVEFLDRPTEATTQPTQDEDLSELKF
jgi:single-strand DNA-binding protein